MTHKTDVDFNTDSDAVYDVGAAGDTYDTRTTTLSSAEGDNADGETYDLIGGTVGTSADDDVEV